jgi:hypothetical protein
MVIAADKHLAEDNRCVKTNSKRAKALKLRERKRMLTVSSKEGHNLHPLQTSTSQEVMERTNPTSFLTLFSNAVINLKNLVPKILRGDTQTDGNGYLIRRNFPFKECRLERYDTAQNYIILYRVVQCLSQHNLIISQHRNI